MSLGSKSRAILVRASQLIKRRPVGVPAAVVTLLVGFAAAATAVAPLAPDASDLPRRLISETVQPDDVDSQLEALAAADLQWYRSDLTRSSDTADRLLNRLGVHDVAATDFLRDDAMARKLFEGRAGKIVNVKVGEQGNLLELTARYAAPRSDQLATHFTRMTVRRSDAGFQSNTEIVPLVAEVRLGGGSVSSSLFAATDEAHIPDAIATQMVEMFSTDIDFRRELKRGDSFSVVYEALTADGEPITWGENGRILAAEFVNNGRSLRSVWFRDQATGRGAYFGLDGKSKRRAFLGSPVEFSRVTSGFAMRFHPILQQWRQHNGVDYGAPSGTPVRCVGDGTVSFAGWQNGYGNVVQVQHVNDRMTVYAHLSRIDVRKGEHVEQGERLGAVGATGWATGPHLHFEFREHGQQRDPLSMARASEALTLSPASQPLFAAVARGAQAQLQAAESIGSGVADAE
jgi:murein DD-endopeptidase MepM/ murein hydrolase activator NlpD